MEMRLSFRMKMLLMVFGLTALAVGSLSVFFLRFYRQDKVLTLYRSERETISRNASFLQNLLDLAQVVDLNRLGNLKELILAVDGPCSADPFQRKSAVSTFHEPHLKELSLLPQTWANSLDVYRLCQSRAPAAAEADVEIIPSATQLMVPFIPILFRSVERSRLALLSMEGFQTLPESTTFLLDREGRVLWSQDSPGFLKGAFDDTGVTGSYLQQLGPRAGNRGKAFVEEVGEDGLISFAPVNSEWVIASLSYRPMLMRPVAFALSQFTLLAVGLSALVLLLGRFMASLLVKPLNELQLSARKIGGGDFDVSFEVKGTDEIATVKQAFNTMAKSLGELVEEKEKAVALEAELNVAKQVQNLLLPPQTVRLKTESLHSFAQSAAQCGGDWWGYLEVEGPEGEPLTVVMIGDATDHGVPAALLTAVIRGAVSVVADWIKEKPAAALDPGGILKRLNRASYEAAKGAITLTFMVVVLDSRNRKLLCANAGHNAAYLIHPSERAEVYKIRPVGKSSIPIGISLDTPFEEVETFPWPKGSKLFMYTDGLIDVMDGDRNLFERKHLRKLIGANERLSGKMLLGRVLEERGKVAKGLQEKDDVTVVVCDAH